jgi:outer membrane lipoprotein-sorting protein
MKKILFIILIGCFLLTGCGNYNEKNIIKLLRKSYDKCNGYKLSGDLSIINNDEVYNYEVNVSYKKDNFYRVTLKNTANDHIQIILKNNDGVYLLTPALNKSFRFQSDWPYNNSQIYLLDALLKDVEKDEKRVFSSSNGQYVYTTKVKYPNNNSLKTQKIILDDSLNIKKVSVYDKDNVEKMSMSFKKINLKPKFKKDEFSIDSVISSENDNTVTETGSLDDIIYPLFLPNGTKLVDEEIVKKDNGQRYIMSYDGDKSFLLVEETTDVMNEFTVIPTSGDMYQLMDTVGIVTDNSLSWTSNGVDYYLVSDVMTRDEMVMVAESIVGIVSMK